MSFQLSSRFFLIIFTALSTTFLTPISAGARNHLTKIKIIRNEGTWGEYKGPGQICSGVRWSPNPVIRTGTNVGFDVAGNARLVYAHTEIHDCRGIKGPRTLSFIGDDQASVLQHPSKMSYELLTELQSASKECPLYLEVNKLGEVVKFYSDCDPY